jgi:tetratricopeptide (TPR) repeat protein
MNDPEEQAAQSGPQKPANEPTDHPAPVAPEGGQNLRRAAVLLALAAGVAYYNSFQGQFIYDDMGSIPHNQTIRHLWPIGPVFSPPAGETVQGRPLLNLSFALNYAFSGAGGASVRAYHVTNLVIHVLAALVLFGILRRTFLLPSMRDRFGRVSLGLALAGALLWIVHPLQTESVAYIVQRAESLMGLFYLLTLYCVIRSAASSRVLWSLAAAAACAAGMATKEVMVTAPLIVLLYDRTFLAGSFRAALRKRWGLYAILAACWGLLAYLMMGAGNREGTAGFGAKQVVDTWTYARTELWAILHYLRLAFWPDALCLDYGWSFTKTMAEALPGAVAVALLAAGTLVGLRRGRKWGFLGAWFLVILAPTSSVVPIRDAVFEHRMYLPLAAVVTMVVLGAFVLWGKLSRERGWFSGEAAPGRWTAPWTALAVVAVVLTGLTVLRNRDYRSLLTIWQDTAMKAPSSPRAHYNFGMALCAADKTDLAIDQFREAIRLNPKESDAYVNLGVALMGRGDLTEAIGQLRGGLALDSGNVEGHNDLGAALCKQGDYDQGINEFHQALHLDPRNITAYRNLGAAYCKQGKNELGLDQYREAIRLNPENPQAYFNLGMALCQQGKTDLAVEQFRKAIEVSPRFVPAYKVLVTVLEEAGRTEEAMEVRRQAQSAASSLPSP